MLEAATSRIPLLWQFAAHIQLVNLRVSASLAQPFSQTFFSISFSTVGVFYCVFRTNSIAARVACHVHWNM